MIYAGSGAPLAAPSPLFVRESKEQRDEQGDETDCGPRPGVSSYKHGEKCRSGDPAREACLPERHSRGDGEDDPGAVTNVP